MPALTLTPSVYHGTRRQGDFSWMLGQDAWSRSLFVYNDNESQSGVYLDQVDAGTVDPASSACQAGAGNGAIRPYQCLTPPRAAGVPTGPGWADLDDGKAAIDRALAHVRTLLETGDYDEVIYSAKSASEPGVLGSGTFSPPKDVLTYIPNELKRIVDEVNAIRDRSSLG
ncbi:hypothetical protein [Rubrivirga marina]|uniref:Uncharacterized protein n=1 Tax=Rubrivirga marina TaxID=1196024 RepID=A0A271J2R0_9BACT|nr:hypothetical protein [Rubrivirga marina]PAP77782.1 hypothetical protein BSZ37_15685 [Rubrivirga marina]